MTLKKVQLPQKSLEVAAILRNAENLGMKQILNFQNELLLT